MCVTHVTCVTCNACNDGNDHSSQVEDMFGGRQPSLELLRKHEEGADLYASELKLALGGGPQPEWHCRLYRGHR